VWRDIYYANFGSQIWDLNKARGPLPSRHPPATSCSCSSASWSLSHSSRASASMPGHQAKEEVVALPGQPLPRCGEYDEGGPNRGDHWIRPTGSRRGRNAKGKAHCTTDLPGPAPAHVMCSNSGAPVSAPQSSPRFASWTGSVRYSFIGSRGLLLETCFVVDASTQLHTVCMYYVLVILVRISSALCSP
jgi:hypothetical protein